MCLLTVQSSRQQRFGGDGYSRAASVDLEEMVIVELLL